MGELYRQPRSRGNVPNVWRFTELPPVFTAIDRFFEASQIGPPGPNDNDHRNADLHTALFAARPWPTEVQEFWDRYAEEYEKIVLDIATELEVKHPAVTLSVIPEARDELLLVTLRQCKKWHHQWMENGANPVEQFKAFVLGPGAIRPKTVIKRELCKTQGVSSAARNWASNGGIDQFSDRGYAAADPITRTRLERALNSLPPLQQRVLRLRYGIRPPAREEWSLKRISRVLNRPVAELETELEHGIAALRRLLTSPPQRVKSVRAA